MDRLLAQASVSHARLGGALSTLLIACLFLVEAAIGDAATRPLRTGISYVYVKDTEDSPVAFQHVREAGARLTLTPLEWGRVAPDREPAAWNPEDPGDVNYKWGPYDSWVRGAVAAGLTPVLQVRGAPRWAQRCGFVGIDTPCDMDPADLAAFATAAARRYSGSFGGLPRVAHWQGPNEPNLSLFFLPQFTDAGAVSADLYRALINAFYSAVKVVNPANLVISGGLGPIAVPKYTIGPMRFTRELLCMRGHRKPRPLPGDCGGGVKFDIFDIHPYTSGSPAHEGGVNDVQMGDLRKLATLLAAADRANRINGAFPRTPLWITELSWDSNPPDPGGLQAKILNRWTAESLYRAWKVGVSDFFWFSLRDFEPDPGIQSFESPESGLYFRGPTVAQDQPKPHLFAFKSPFVAYPRKRGLRFWGRTPESGPGPVRIQVRRKGRWRTVLVTRADKFGIFEGVAEIRYGRKRAGAARAYFGQGASVPFSMKPIGDFRHAPFGDPLSS